MNRAAKFAISAATGAALAAALSPVTAPALAPAAYWLMSHPLPAISPRAQVALLVLGVIWAGLSSSTGEIEPVKPSGSRARSFLRLVLEALAREDAVAEDPEAFLIAMRRPLF